MKDSQKIYDGLSKVAWGYFFVYFNININNVSLLPAFVGYLLLLSAITCLQEEERELSMLRPLGSILVLWNVAVWLASWGSFNLDGAWQLADIIISIMNLYFHFQLLTNLATIATKYQPDGYEQDAKLLWYRTLQTIMLTAILVVTYLRQWLSEIWTYITVAMLVVYYIAGICLMKALFTLRRCIAENTQTQ